MVLLGLLSGCTSITDYDYLGEGTPVQLRNNLYNSVELEFSNDIGVVDIKSETNAAYAVSVILHIHSRDTDKYTIEEAEELTVTTPEPNKTKISFISNPENIGIPNYKYNLTIVVNTGITVATDIDVSTGLVTINLKDSTISELTLESSAGSKEIAIINCKIIDETPFIEASTGSTDISLTNLNFTVLTARKISSSTGTIDMTINGITAGSGTHSFTVSASTGDVGIDSTLSGIGKNNSHCLNGNNNVARRSR
ncbi:MAG: hypothetical protein ACFE8U_16340 [Candidatus Hermodarchaeota archaeon]